jgi:hypothetical protein
MRVVISSGRSNKVADDEGDDSDVNVETETAAASTLG